MIRHLWVWGLVVAFAVGCTPTDETGVGLPETEWTEARVAELLSPPPKLTVVEEPEAPPPLPRRRPEQLAALPPAEAADAAAPKIEGLVGLDFDATEALLGEPALEQVQAPARVWAYNGTGCVLSIFFYPNVDGQSYRALTYEVKGAEESPDRVRECFAELVQERKGT